MIAASVWITLEIANPFGAWIWRCRAETMPLVTVRSRPNGLPIATTGSPTSIFDESPRASGVHLVGRSVDLQQRQVGGRVGADHLGVVGGLGVAELHLDLLGAGDDVVVGQDVPVGVDQEPRAGGDAAPGLAEGVERGNLARRLLRLDEGDPLTVTLVDLVDRVGGSTVMGVDRRGRERCRGDRRSASFGLDPAGRDRQQPESGDDRAAEDGGPERGAEEALDPAHRAADDPRGRCGLPKRPRNSF